MSRLKHIQELAILHEVIDWFNSEAGKEWFNRLAKETDGMNAWDFCMYVTLKDNGSKEAV